MKRSLRWKGYAIYTAHWFRMLEVPGEWDITSQLRTLEGTLHCSVGPNAHVCAFAAFAVCRLPHCRLPFAALPFARLQHAFAVCAFAARTFAAFHVAFKFRCMESKEEDMIAARRCNSTTWSTEHWSVSALYSCQCQACKQHFMVCVLMDPIGWPHSDRRKEASGAK